MPLQVRNIGVDMIKCVSGDIFDSRAEILVNPVNCVGVSGAGLALQFKKRFPVNQREYEDMCKSGHMRLGRVFPARSGKKGPPYFIVNLPTKQHWRDKSRLDEVARGVDDLVRYVGDIIFHVEEVAVPALGCGYGGLDWTDVWGMLQDKLDPVLNVQFTVYQPMELSTPRRGLWR